VCKQLTFAVEVGGQRREMLLFLALTGECGLMELIGVPAGQYNS
jgi:hypothetical protein